MSRFGWVYLVETRNPGVGDSLFTSWEHTAGPIKVTSVLNIALEMNGRNPNKEVPQKESALGMTVCWIPC